MKIRIVLITALFLLLQSELHAQAEGYDAQDNLNALGADNVNGVIRKFDKRYEGIRGTPFFINEWRKGAVVTKNGKKTDNIELKIDLYNHDVVMKRTNGDSIVLFANTVDQVLLNDPNTGKTAVFRKFNYFRGEAPGPKDAFVEVLYEGKNTLLAERKKTLIKASYTGAYNDARPYDEFRNELNYYLKKQGGSLEKIKLNKKSVLDALPDHQNALKTFVSKENIDFKNDADVVKLLQYYDGL